MTANHTGELDLLSFLCEKDPKGSEQEVYSQWVSQASFIPPANQLPIHMQIIRNLQKSRVPKELKMECVSLLQQ